MSALEKAVSQLVVRGVSSEDARRILLELLATKQPAAKERLESND